MPNPREITLEAMLKALHNLPNGPRTTRFEEVDGTVHGVYDEDNRALYVSQALYDLIKVTYPRSRGPHDVPMFSSVPIKVSKEFAFKRPTADKQAVPPETNNPSF